MGVGGRGEITRLRRMTVEGGSSALHGEHGRAARCQQQRWSHEDRGERLIGVGGGERLELVVRRQQLVMANPVARSHQR
ncbi:Os07g0499851 [Oryza sativa Japonica Group]|jgi:hypothetical protein|uniref:Os07g0499851 protein n=2 Tax=Oryza sativa subsp. japonica TaxID=39947 RepID=Q69RN7_ORYSJ|nr:hypothetical protein [Oryza sativa Japonica Group]BAT01634.1 Os07g0499851 [Oryza sativa Japonica Group]